MLPLDLQKPGVGQNIAVRASPTAMNFSLVIISTFPTIHLLPPPRPLPTVTALVFADAVCVAGPRNKKGRPACPQKQLMPVCTVSTRGM